jgi:HD-GYP domain-containing protein (c-di-GMP phosphodiesterase class II)
LADVPEFSYVIVGSAVSLAGMEGQGGRANGRPLDLRGRLDMMATVVNRVADDEPVPLPAVFRLAEGLERDLQSATDPIGFLAPFEDEDSWLHVHAHNTAVLGVSMAVALDLDTEIRHDIAVAAILHDVGKFGLPVHQVRHDLDLTGSEWELNFNHPQIGLERLLAVPQIPEIACIVAFDHHLRSDGEGYPTLPSPRAPHPAAALVAVAEAVDIMMTVRVPRGAMGQLEVVETLHQSAGGVFDPYLARIMAAILQVPRF